MQEIKKLITPNEINSFVRSLWKSEQFKSSHDDPAGYINAWTNKFKQFPRIFFKTTDDHIEKGHFTSWMNCIAIREYENPVVQDLYYLHEILHATTMPYLNGADFETWRQKIFKNELETSLDSEVLVYFNLPIRKESFTFPIWADKFLGTNVDYKTPKFKSFLTSERKKIFEDKNVLLDPVQLEISRYQKQNEAWSEIWKNNYIQVESQLLLFYETCKTSKETAIDNLERWLMDQIILSKKPYPFENEAKLFSKIYWKEKKI